MAFIKLPEGAAPSTPATGTVIIYAKADGYFYSKDDAGTETKLGAGIGLADANTFTAQQSFTGTAATAPAIAGASDPNTGVFFPAADTVAVSTAGVERMRIDSSGNVGIGAAPNSSWGSSYKGIDINGLGNIQSNGTSFTCVGTNIYNNGSEWRAKTTGSGALLLSGAGGYGAYSFYSFDSTTADTAVTLKALGGFTSAGVWLWSQPVASGYGTGAGGTVIQPTSRITATPAINKPTGQITMFTAAGSATPATFRVSNTLIAATDTVLLTVSSSTNTYIMFASKIVAATGFDVTFYSAVGTASDTPVVNFTIIKGSAS